MSGSWLAANRANWDERVPLHLRAYDLAALRAGQGRLYPIEEAEAPLAPGDRVLHLQCHIGSDTLVFAQRGAQVTGLDFSPAAIAAARGLAAELSLPARFVEAEVLDAPEVLAEPASFHLVFASWGAINWIPDIRRWIQVAAHFLQPGGHLYLADAHPAAYVFDDSRAAAGLPGFFMPYFSQEPAVLDDPRDYADIEARLVNARTYEWIHPLSDILAACASAQLEVVFLHEHDAVPWRMFEILTEHPDGMYRWPRERWLPLAFSILARRPQC